MEPDEQAQSLAVIDVESEAIDNFVEPEELEETEQWYSALQIQGLLRLSKAGLQQSISKLQSIYGLDITTLRRGAARATSGGDKRPRTFTGKCFRALDPPQKFRLIDKIISRVKKYPVVIKKKGLANTTRPKSIICYPHSIIPYSKNI